jgi:hypothetical protein
MDYGTLKADILATSHRTDLAADVPRFVRLAEGLIARELKSAYQSIQATLTETERVDAGVYSLPAGLLEVRGVYYDGSQLGQVAVTRIRRRPAAAAVREFAVVGENIEFRGVPPADAILELDYFGRFAALSDDLDTNAILERHEALYLYGSLFHLYQHTQDIELAQAALDTFTDAIDKLNEAEGRKLGGAAVAGAYNLFGAGSDY